MIKSNLGNKLTPPTKNLKKVTLNELRQVVRKIIKEESESKSTTENNIIYYTLTYNGGKLWDISRDYNYPTDLKSNQKLYEHNINGGLNYIWALYEDAMINRLIRYTDFDVWYTKSRIRYEIATIFHCQDFLSKSVLDPKNKNIWNCDELYEIVLNYFNNPHQLECSTDSDY